MSRFERGCFLLGTVIGALCWAWAQAQALAHANDGPLSATAEGDTVTIYTSTPKAEPCEATIRFTYLHDGKRLDGWTSCSYFVSKPGKHVEACHFTNPQIVAPLLNGDVIGGCGPGHERPKK